MTQGDDGAATRTAVLETGGVQWGSEKARVEAVLGRRPGVTRVEANPVSQTATVSFDSTRTSVVELRDWIRDCGYHCAGQSVPNHLCDPLAMPAPEGPVAPPSPHEAEAVPEAAVAQDHHAVMDMSAMVTDMRNRFLVALIFSIPILLWSPIGRDVFGFNVSAPFGLRDDVWMLLLSLPVIFYSASIFFVGAIAALRAHTLDMMVLVAVGVGAGWLYSLGVTLTGDRRHHQPQRHASSTSQPCRG